MDQTSLSFLDDIEIPVASERTPLSDVIVGVAMIVLSIACATAYLVILIGIWRDRDLLRMNSYKFMFLLGVFDVVQCLPHTVTGFFTIYQTTWGYGLAKTMGVLATPFYVGYAVMTVILSINRFIQLASPRLEDFLFSPKGVKAWMGIGIGSCLLYVIALSSPYASIVYFPDMYSWDYDYDLPLSWLVQRIEMYIEIGGIFVSAFFYSIVLAILFRTRRHFQTSKTFHVELKILIQALVITVYCTILNVFWHNYQVLLPANLWSYMGLNFMWIGNSGIYPVIYFVVNKTIREKIYIGSDRTVVARTNMRILREPTTMYPIESSKKNSKSSRKSNLKDDDARSETRKIEKLKRSGVHLPADYVDRRKVVFVM